MFDDRERSALRWTEEITRVSESHAGKDAFDALKPHFSDDEIAWLTLAAAMINTWNRIAISSRAQYDPAMFHRTEAKVTEPA
jgi:alkylhydroperoxidase family enzyme